MSPAAASTDNNNNSKAKSSSIFKLDKSASAAKTSKSQVNRHQSTVQGKASAKGRSKPTRETEGFKSGEIMSVNSNY